MKLRLLMLAALAAATTVLSTVPASAQSQPWLSDRRYGEGIGIRTGSLELHPGVAGEVGYDSNYFQRSGDQGEVVISAYRLRITPSLSLSTLGPQRRGNPTAGTAAPKLNFRAGVFAAYNELIAADSTYSEQMSDQRHIDAGASFMADILPQRPVGVDFYGDFIRTVEPSNRLDTNFAWDRDSLRLGGGTTWRPGGGLFDWRLGYELLYTHFERERFQNLDNAYHFINTRGRFRFLPRTALMYDAEWGFLRHSNPGIQNNAETIRSRVGVNGLITNHFAALAMVGWAASFYEGTGGRQARNYDSLVGQGELKWFILPQPRLQPGDATVGVSSVAAGYVRDFGNSYLGDYYLRDRVYGDFSYFIGGRVLIDIEAGYARVAHPTLFFPSGAFRKQAFKENRVDAQLFAEYRTSDTFGINTTFRYDASLDDTYVRTQEAPAAGGVIPADNLAFSRWQIWLGARWFM